MLFIPEAHRDLFLDATRAFAVLTTSMPDGSPQATPVWFDVEEDLIRVNTARGRAKERNMTHRPRIALAILDPANPYRYLQIRGTVIESTEEGARQPIDRLPQKYLGKERYPWPGDTPRVIFHIGPDRVSNTA
jgi:PPOX class probable F420-dependent enzyme